MRCAHLTIAFSNYGHLENAMIMTIFDIFEKLETFLSTIFWYNVEVWLYGNLNNVSQRDFLYRNLSRLGGFLNTHIDIFEEENFFFGRGPRQLFFPNK